MSESLRDQLLKAGFKDTGTAQKKKRSAKASAKPRSRPARAAQHNSTGQSEAAAQKAAEKKATKEKIKALIESDHIRDFSGAVAFSYQLGSRVKQLYINEQCQRQLASGDLLITRLNGSTFLIPPTTAEQIASLNPEWALVKAGADTAESPLDDAYAEYQVPDDLNW